MRVLLAFGFIASGWAQFFPGPGSTSSVAAVCTPATGYAHCRLITIDHTKVGASDSIGFPLLISGTLAYLADSGHGGLVQHTTTQTAVGGASIIVPADLIFTVDSAGATKVAGWEFETYDNTTGILVAWINIATLSHTADTLLYMSYDNASVSTWQGNVSATWKSAFVGVWHLPNGSSVNYGDSTSNAANGTPGATQAGTPVATMGTASTGQIDGAVDFSMTGIPSAVGNFAVSNLGLTSTFTFYGWINVRTSTGCHSGAIAAQAAAGSMEWRLDSACTISLLQQFVAVLATSTSTVPTLSAFHHVAVTVNPTTVSFYIDGAPAGVTTIASAFASAAYTWGYATTASESLDSQLDESEALNIVVSADWIKAIYNNQNVPSTFSTIGVQH